MNTNELLVNTIMDMSEERVLRNQEMNAANRKVAELSQTLDAEYILNSQIEDENNELTDEVACLKVDLDEAKKEIATLQAKLDKACKKK